MLALCVLFTHSVPFGNLNYLDGITAVESFFVISGFYMAFVLSEKYTQERLGNSYIRKFYLSRYLRLYPAYLIGLVSLLLLDWFATRLSHTSIDAFSAWQKLLSLPLTFSNFMLILWAAVSNLTIFFQDLGGVIAVRGQHAVFTFHRFSSDFYVWPLNITSVAWSLGVELMFYLIAPFLLKRTNRQLFALAAFALFLKIFAIVAIGNDLPFRMFPFVFVNFMVGVLAYRMRSSLINSLGKFTVPIGYCLMLAITTGLPTGGPEWGYSIVVIGVTGFIVPILFDNSKHSKLDNRIGELSYPFYLFHFMALSIIHFIITKRAGITNIYLVSTCCVLLTLFFSQVVLRLEARYLEPYRQKLGRSSPTWAQAH